MKKDTVYADFRVRQTLQDIKETDTEAFSDEVYDYCRDKDCPLYVLGAVHKKGIVSCKYG